MEPFNIKEFTENPTRKVVTRNGEPVRIQCTNIGLEQGIAGVIQTEDVNIVTSWYKNGKWKIATESGYDLFFAPTGTDIGYINIFNFGNGMEVYGKIYTSKEEAKNSAYPDSFYIKTIKIKY